MEEPNSAAEQDSNEIKEPDFQRLAYLKQAEVERMRRQIAIKRHTMLQKIRQQLHVDFLGMDAFFRDARYSDFISYSDLISQQEFEQEKIAFVKAWIVENTPTDKNGKKYLPDDEQVAAIAAVQGHNQIIARAGSGKTTTLVNRAFFLMKHCGVASNEILLLAFNRKAALEIRKKLLQLLAEKKLADEIKHSPHRDEYQSLEAIAAQLEIQLPHIMTFHALAYAIVHPENPPLHDQEDEFAQELSRVVQQIIDDSLASPLLSDKIRTLMLAKFHDDWHRIVNGGYDKKNNKQEFLQFRRALKHQSLNGDYIKSFGEKVIANFLFEHAIPYKYEKNHHWNGINYRPDFTIPPSDKIATGFIIEYFGMEGEEDYDEMSQQKRDYWQNKEGWVLIEVFPHHLTENGIAHFIQQLKDYFQQWGFACERLSEEEIWQQVKNRKIDHFTEAVTGFIGKCKKQNLSVFDLKNLMARYAPISEIEPLFHELACHFYTAYLETLTATGREDFDGLIQTATALIKQGKIAFDRKQESGDLLKLRHICIDEFQDFSELFYQLLDAIRVKNPAVNLFCVGDDWQAINGFAGSDLRFFREFSHYIGASKPLYLSTNYRSSKAIVSLGNALMNEQGLEQSAIAHKTIEGEVLLADLDKFNPSCLETERHFIDKCTPAVLRVASQALLDDFDVVILCRTNKHFGNELNHYLKQAIHAYFPQELQKRITISTAHKYKGLEKAVVIVPDATDRRYPLIHPHWIFARILGDSEEKITAEERRLFYVTLTRAVEKLVIFTEQKRQSPFLQSLQLREINWEDYPPQVIPHESSRLIVKIGNQGRDSSPTHAIKESLKTLGYKWNAVGWESWWKSFPNEGFSIELIKTEVWVKSAHGVEVRIFDAAEKMLSRFHVNAGAWLEVFEG